jgi:nucleoid-associated protein YgaU
MTAYYPFGRNYGDKKEADRVQTKQRAVRYKSLKLYAGFMLVLICSLAWFEADAKGTDAAPTESSQLIYVVGQGDTLWSIAGEYAEEGTDIRQFIDRVKKINELRGSLLKPGQQLIIPLS